MTETEVDLRWLNDPEPYLVKVPRVPVVGEIFIGPDEPRPLEVTRVSYLYDRGFYFEATRIVVETKPVSVPESVLALREPQEMDE